MFHKFKYLLLKSISFDIFLLERLEVIVDLKQFYICKSPMDQLLLNVLPMPAGVFNMLSLYSEKLPSSINYRP